MMWLPRPQVEGRLEVELTPGLPVEVHLDEAVAARLRFDRAGGVLTDQGIHPYAGEPTRWPREIDLE